MPNLSQNIRIVFSDTISNTGESTNDAAAAFRDINRSLMSAINSHIASPVSNFSFHVVGFGHTWKNSYTESGLPTNILRSHADWIDPLLKPILADAVAQKVTLLSALMNAAAPPIAIAATPIVAATLGSMPGGVAISSTLTTAVSTATVTPGAQPTIPGLVAAALVAMAGIITAARLAPETAAVFAQTLHFQLNTIGVAGASETPRAAWATVNPQVLGIPINPILLGELGPNFWRAILITINQAIPGTRT